MSTHYKQLKAVFSEAEKTSRRVRAMCNDKTDTDGCPRIVLGALLEGEHGFYSPSVKLIFDVHGRLEDIRACPGLEQFKKGEPIE
jgi:hypothetical protein